MTIPEDVKQKIKEISRLKDVPEEIEEIMSENSEINYAAAYGYYGYSLSSEQLEAKDKEIQRLKGLIEKAFDIDYYPDGDIQAAWQQFKTKNNIEDGAVYTGNSLK